MVVEICRVGVVEDFVVAGVVGVRGVVGVVVVVFVVALALVLVLVVAVVAVGVCLGSLSGRSSDTGKNDCSESARDNLAVVTIASPCRCAAAGAEAGS